MIRGLDESRTSKAAVLISPYDKNSTAEDEGDSESELEEEEAEGVVKIDVRVDVSTGCGSMRNEGKVLERTLQSTESGVTNQRCHLVVSNSNRRCPSTEAFSRNCLFRFRSVY